MRRTVYIRVSRLKIGFGLWLMRVGAAIAVEHHKGHWDIQHFYVPPVPGKPIGSYGVHFGPTA